MRNPGTKLQPNEVSWIIEDKIRNGPYTPAAPEPEPEVCYDRELTTAESVAYLGVSEAAFRRLVKSGQIAPVRRVGSAKMYQERALKRLHNPTKETQKI